MKQLQIMIQEKISPVDQTEKHESLSDKYSLINTRSLLDIAEKQGFKLASLKYPKGKNSAHALHIARLDLPGYENTEVNGYKPQVIIQNSHDGTSSIRILTGVFRLVCSNGLVAGDTTLNLRLRHVGLKQADVEQAFYIAAKQAAAMADKVEAFKTKLLSLEQEREYIQGALKIRAATSNLSETETASLLNINQNYRAINQPIRRADQGQGLWEVFNRIQEHSVKASGLIYTGDDNKPHRLHSVNSIRENTNLNQALWELTEKFAA